MGRREGRECHGILAAKEGYSAEAWRQLPGQVQTKAEITWAPSCSSLYIWGTAVKSGFMMPKQVITGTLKCDPKEASKKKTKKEVFLNVLDGRYFLVPLGNS